jgi:hypothetical protein
MVVEIDAGVDDAGGTFICMELVSEPASSLSKDTPNNLSTNNPLIRRSSHSHSM